MTLDTRNNLLSVLLIGAIALLVLVGLVSFWLLGRVDVSAIEPGSTARGIIDRPVAENPSLSELSQYAQIVERPVFFADRSLPVMEVAGTEEEAAEPEETPEIEIPALEASVAGIIITPEVKLAMVTDSASNETLVLREGMSMSGEKSAWKVASIRARGVRFETEGGRSEDLELEVETDALARGERPAARTADTGSEATETRAAAETPQDEQEQMDAARARAEEIRKRVAERRAQLRAEAERRAREQDGGGP